MVTKENEAPIEAFARFPVLLTSLLREMKIPIDVPDDPKVTTVVIEHKDRLGRMNVELVEAALSATGRRLVVLDDGEVDDDLVRDDFEAQARQAFANLDKVLTAAGSSLSTVVKVNIMVTDMGYLDTIVELRREFFTKPYPADNLLKVAGLAQPDWLVEIDVVALVRA